MRYCGQKCDFISTDRWLACTTARRSRKLAVGDTYGPVSRDAAFYCAPFFLILLFFCFVPKDFPPFPDITRLTAIAEGKTVDLSIQGRFLYVIIHHLPDFYSKKYGISIIHSAFLSSQRGDYGDLFQF